MPHRSSNAASTTADASASTSDSTNDSAFYTREQTSSDSLIQTVWADVSSERIKLKTRALVDSVATVSVITSQLAHSQKAKRHASDSNIEGIGGPLGSNHTVELTLSSPHGYSDQAVAIEAHIVDRICNDTKEQFADHIKQMKFLEGKQLADPYLGQAGRVDLLLSILDSFECFLDGTAFSEDRKLRAQETIFGWAIGGTVDDGDPRKLAS